MIHNDILVYDSETDSTYSEKVNMKWFGAYSYKTKEYYLFDCCEREDDVVLEQIKKLIKDHKVLVGFNNKQFDNTIMERYGISFEYKVVVDLWEISAPKGNRGAGNHNKNKLSEMGIINLKNYKLKTIIETLKLDDKNKGDIDYKIFQKNKWTEEETKEIKKYLKQDIDITMKLFEWFVKQYDPIKHFLPKKSQNNFHQLTSSSASLGYKIICHQVGLEEEYEDKPKKKEGFLGAHEILNRKKKYKGNLISIDFASMYPHSLVMGNLFSVEDKGWNGNPYFKLKGYTENKTQGKIELVLKELMIERLKAKKSGDKIKSKAYKIIINAIYGLTGSPLFKSMFNETTAGNCTAMGRTIIKKLAKTLEEEEFEVIYGFTDSVYCRIPKESSEEELMEVVDRFIKEVKSKVPFPAETFKLEVEERIKFIWFNARKSYLYVKKNDEVFVTDNILNKNTPKATMNIFNEYMKPKIVKEFDIKFSEQELIKQLKIRLKDNPELAGENYKVADKKTYPSKTSPQFQISEAYGEGEHLLIPNLKGIGIGKAKSTKKKIGVRKCTIEEFKKNNLKVEDIDLNNLMNSLKPFITKTPQERLK